MITMSKDTMVIIQILTLMIQMIVAPALSGVICFVFNVICSSIIIGLCIARIRRG